MSTKKKSAALAFVEKVAGRSLTLGGLMESIRLSEEQSLAAFAKKLGISASHLCDIEKGRKAVSALRAEEFAKNLGMSKTQFIRLALQDELNRSGLKYKITVEVA